MLEQGGFLGWSLFLINFIKKRLQHRCFPVNIAKFLQTLFSIEHLWWLLVTISNSNMGQAGII